MTYSRFVAIGDSQTEGIGDGDDAVGHRGWADRLADELATINPELRYANLAIRGRRTRQIGDEQVGPATSMSPDLIAAPLGMNDVLANTAMEQVHADLDQIYSTLAQTSATVLIATFPNVSEIVPFARRIESRLLTLNDMMRQFAATYDMVLVDLHAAPVLVDQRSWSSDRLHASPLGHNRFAAGAAHALRLPGSDPNWGALLDRTEPLSSAQKVISEVQWTRAFLVPWLIRRLRGVSTGDGRSPKRPELTPVHLV